ncbi:MAG: OBG GTPase family GTP-binding protein [Nanobdellota archaeon]
MVRESGNSATQEQIKELEDRIAKTKYNKKTQHAIGLYKAKLAALREKQEKRSGTGKSDHGWTVRKSGDASVVLLGFPSVGKSSLLNAITNANSEVGAYAFTTLDCIPGDLEYNGAKIQLLDVPGIVKGAAAGTGRGKEVLQVIRNADLIILLLDVFFPDHLEVLLKEVFDTYVRLDQKKPDVRIKKTTKGGISVGTTVKLTHLTEDTIRGILKEFRISNADVLLREDIDADQLIDVIESNRAYVPSLRVLNKIDMVDAAHLEQIKSQVLPDVCISAANGVNLEDLKEQIFQKLELMPVYCKEVGEKADTNEPLILRKGNTVRDMCRKLHKDFEKKFKFARVWGESAKFPGQKLSLKHELALGDVVELHVR